MQVNLASSRVPLTYGAMTVNTLPKKTGNTRIDALLTGSTNWWHDDSNVSGTAGAAGMSNAKHEITFSFMTTANSLRTNDVRGFQAMNAAAKQAARDALAQAAAVANLTFTEVESGGNIQFGTNNQLGKSGGYAYTPNSSGANIASVYIANDVFNQETTDWSPGTHAWATMVHEVGHALGLKHPGAYNAGGGKTPGPYLPKSEDNTRYSIMSYNDPADANVGATRDLGGGRYSVSIQQVQPWTYQMDDISTLQYMYGRSHSEAQTGVNTYELSDDAPTDAGFLGTISNENIESTIDASGSSRRNIIDLRAGHFSSMGIRDPYAALAAPFNTAKKYASLVKSGKKPSYAGYNNLGLALGSKVGGAKGGSAADTIVGNNEAANVIDSGGGNDTIFLGKANSTVNCGEGTDTVCLAKLKTRWTVTFNAEAGTYTARNGAITSVITGAEAIKGWNGKTLKVSKLA